MQPRPRWIISTYLLPNSMHMTLRDAIHSCIEKTDIRCFSGAAIDLGIRVSQTSHADFLDNLWFVIHTWFFLSSPFKFHKGLCGFWEVISVPLHFLIEISEHVCYPGFLRTHGCRVFVAHLFRAKSSNKWETWDEIMRYSSHRNAGFQVDHLNECVVVRKYKENQVIMKTFCF